MSNISREIVIQCGAGRGAHLVFSVSGPQAAAAWQAIERVLAEDMAAEELLGPAHANA